MLDIFLNSSIIEPICWTVVHSLWQFTIVGIASYFLLQKIPLNNVNLRYNILLISMMTCLLSSMITFGYYYESPENSIALLGNSGSHSSSTLGISFTSNVTISNQVLAFIQTNYLVISVIWFVGFIILFAKMILSFWYIKRLNATAILNKSSIIVASLNTIKQQLNLSKEINVKWSNSISTPIVTGWITPIILFPLSCINQLTIEETESILAHELAHIKRNDFIVNAFQSLLEVLFYYHPMIWWMSNLMKVEREHCCDQIAINTTGTDSICYAKTLLKIEEISTITHPQLALSFLGNKEHLLGRISRILNQSKYKNNMKTNIVSLLLICMIFFGFTYAETTKNKLIDPIDKLESVITTIINNSSNKELHNNELDQKLVSIQNINMIDTLKPTLDKSIVLIKRKSLSSDSPFQNIDISEENGVKTVIISKEKNGVTSIDTLIMTETSKPYIIEKDGNKTFIMTYDSDELSSRSINIDSIVQSRRSMSLNKRDKLKRLRSTIDLNKEFESDITFIDELKLDSIFNSIKFDSIDMRLHIALGDISSDVSKEIALIEGLNFDELMDKIELDSIMQNVELEMSELFSNGVISNQINDVISTRIYDSRTSTHHEFSLTDKILNKMYDEKLIIKGDNNRIKLSGRKLKINGKTQEKALWRRYKNYYEQLMGSKLSKRTKLEFKDF